MIMQLENSIEIKKDARAQMYNKINLTKYQAKILILIINKVQRMSQNTFLKQVICQQVTDGEIQQSKIIL